MVLLSNMKVKILMYARQYWFEILLLFIMSLLVFINLDWRYFAADEAYNVTMGQYIIKNNGIPKVWDGKNIITTINGNDFNDDLVCINLNYGAYYITALAQLLFGKNTYLIRLPFAIMGIISSIVWYKYFKNTTSNNVARIFLLLYSLSIPIIIYIRNANYFAPSLLFVGLMHLYYKNCLWSNRKKDYSLFILFSFAQFHINYMLFVFSIIPILFDSIVTKKCTKSFVMSYIVVFLTTFPFFVWMRYNFYLIGSSYRSVVKIDFITGYYRLIEQIWHISYYIAPIIPLAAILLVIKALHHKKCRKALDGMVEKKQSRTAELHLSLLFTIMFNFVFLSFFTLEFETRYYMAVFPFMYIVLAMIIDNIFKIERICSIIIVMLLLFTNVLNMLPYNLTNLLNIDMNNKGIRALISSPMPSSFIPDGNYAVSSLIYNSYFWEYISTLCLPIKDEVNVLVNYLNENASSGDTISTFGTDAWTNSIQYYTNLNLVNNLRRNYGSWANDSYYPNADRFYNLVYCPDMLVDWVILPSALYGSDDLINVYLDKTKYKCIFIEKNIGGMANDIWLYNFGPRDKVSYVILYKKIE